MNVVKAAGRMLKKNLGSTINIGLGTYFAADAYGTSRSEGNGVMSSALNGVMEGIVPMMMGPASYIGYEAITSLPGAAITAAEGLNTYGRGLSKQSNQTPFKNATFVDTQQTYTMRQAGMSLAQKSKYSLQQTMLGNEAQHMHR